MSLGREVSQTYHQPGGRSVHLHLISHTQTTLPPSLPSLSLLLLTHPSSLSLPPPPSVFLSPSPSPCLLHTHAVLKHTPLSNLASQTTVSLSQLHLTPWHQAASVALGDQRTQVQSTHHQCLSPDEHTPL